MSGWGDDLLYLAAFRAMPINTCMLDVEVGKIIDCSDFFTDFVLSFSQNFQTKKDIATKTFDTYFGLSGKLLEAKRSLLTLLKSDESEIETTTGKFNKFILLFCPSFHYFIILKIEHGKHNTWIVRKLTKSVVMLTEKIIPQLSNNNEFVSTFHNNGASTKSKIQVESSEEINIDELNLIIEADSLKSNLFNKNTSEQSTDFPLSVSELVDFFQKAPIGLHCSGGENYYSQR